MRLGRAVLAGVVVVLGCGPAVDGPAVTVGESAGVPVYSLSHLPAWDDPEYQWDLTLERAIPTKAETTEGDPLLYQPQGYARLADGTLVVLDGGDLRIAILDPSRNEVVRRFAPSGQGPGEILSPNSVIWTAGPSSFWILDQGNQRLSRFNVSGALEEERPVRLGGAGRLVVQDPVEHAPWFWSFFAVQENEVMTLVDSIGRLDLEGQEAVYIAPMAPRVEEQRRIPPAGSVDLLAPIVWFAPLGPTGVVSGRSDSGRFRLYSVDGTLEGVIDVPMERSAVAESEKLDLLEEFNSAAGGRAGMAERYVGERYSLFELMWGVEDSLFALQQHHLSTPSGERPIPDGQRVWRVLSTSGQYGGTVVFPEGTAHPYWIERSRVIATHRDEFGVVTIQEYRLARPGGENRPDS